MREISMRLRGEFFEVNNFYLDLVEKFLNEMQSNDSYVVQKPIFCALRGPGNYRQFTRVKSFLCEDYVVSVKFNSIVEKYGLDFGKKNYGLWLKICSDSKSVLNEIGAQIFSLNSSLEFYKD